MLLTRWGSNPQPPDHPYIIVPIYSQFSLSQSKGLSEILVDFRTSTYQICRTEEKIIRMTTFNIYECNLTPEVRDTLKILWIRGEIAPLEQFLLFSTIFCYLLLDFHVKTGTRFSFEIREVEITSRLYYSEIKLATMCIKNSTI